jgi:hypothetical protein
VVSPGIRLITSINPTRSAGYDERRPGLLKVYGSTVMVQNAPSEGLPPGCSCVLMLPGTTYEARVLDPGCRVHDPAGHQRGWVAKSYAVTRRRNGY